MNNCVQTISAFITHTWLVLACAHTVFLQRQVVRTALALRLTQISQFLNALLSQLG
jgi:hypothetical protein